MRFPASPRVIYRNNPLIGVTCQFNFPAILRIGTEVPAAFQERIRQQYPVFQESSGFSINVQLPQQIASAVNPLFRTQTPTYQFLDDSPDSSVWTISLSQNALSMSTSHYVRWEDYRAHLHEPLQALVDVYGPSFFTRIGLRYQNIICRSAAHISNTPWRDLLNQQIVGILVTADEESEIEGATNQALIRLDEDRKVLFRHGLAVQADTQEQCYLIDNDFFTEKRTEASDARTVLDSLNEASGRIFRWCISDTLHTALEPQPV